MESKTSYVLSHTPGWYLTVGNTGVTTLGEAKHYETPQLAIIAASKAGYALLGFDKFTIIKVTTTASGATRVLGDRQIVNLALPVVIYTPYTKLYAGFDNASTSKLQDARVFSDGSAAIEHMVQTSIDGGRDGSVRKAASPIHLVNVRYVTAAPIVTTVVL